MAPKTPGKRRVNPKILYPVIVVTLVIVISLTAVLIFLMGEQTPKPVITGTGNGWDNEGTTYILYVTVVNNGASGNVQVFAEVKTQSFDQTQDKTVYLNSGANMTVAFEFNSQYLAVETINRQVRVAVP